MTTENSKSILIVDTDAAFIKELTASFKGRQYDIREACSGAQALELLNEQEVDVIIAADALPDMTGLDLMSQAMTLYSDLIAISVTESSSLEAALEGMRRGVMEYLSKPLNYAEFSGTVADRLRERDAYIAGKGKVKDVMGQLMPENAHQVRIIACPEGVQAHRSAFSFAALGETARNIPGMVKKFFWDID